MHDHHHTAPHVHTADGHTAPEGRVIAPGALWEGEARRRLWIDASAGASGDMLLAALIDAGADKASVARVLELVAPGKLHLQERRVQRGPFSALKVDVIADEPNPPHRHLSDIRAMLAADGIPSATRELALAAFTRLASAEAKVHGADIEEVHFHEVGALDSIGDVVGVAEAIRTLGITEASSSVIAVGHGYAHTQHGVLSVPVPAVLEMSRGWQIEAGGENVGELCTPTGMALIRSVATHVEPMPRMQVEASGVGAGGRDRKDRANIVRVIVGAVQQEHTQQGTMREVSANVDDLDPRVWPSVIDALLDAGAVDAWLTPIVMKKGRPAHTIVALTAQPHQDAVVDAIIEHTSTIGVRITAPMHRRVLERASITLDVAGHQVRIKVSGDGPSGIIQQATAEFADVERLASELGVAQYAALAWAQAAAWNADLRPGAPWPSQERNEQRG